MRFNINLIILVLLIISICRNSVFAQSTMELLSYGNKCRNSITIDSGDTVWTGSNSSGLQKCYNDTCYSLTILNSGIASNKVEVVSVDSTGKLWTASSGFGISIFDHVSWTYLNTQNSGLVSDTVNCITHTINGAWIGTNHGLSFYDGTTWTNYTTANSGLLSDTVQDIASDGSIVYCSHPSGISGYNGVWNTWSSPLSFDKADIELVAGRLWINTTSGNVYFMNQNNFIWLNSLLNDFSPRESIYLNTLPGAKIMTPDKSGNLYITFLGIKCYTLKINSLLDIQINKIIYNTGSNFLLSRSVFNNDIIYETGLTGRLRKITLDTSRYVPKEYLYGLANDYLDVNNATARILNRGDMHWDPYSQEPAFFNETWNKRKTVYCSAIWLGGMDQSGLLHSVAQNYRQSYNFNFIPGPMDTISGTGDTITMKQYDRFWKIDYSMIQSFITNYQNGNVQNGTYLIPEAIANWPAHGTGNHTRQLAPFVDANGDGFYNPMDGDYPELTGHQMLWWVFNDSTVPYPHYDPEGPAFQFEIQGKAYGYNCNLNQAADEVMNNTTFYQYKITNRSQNTYHDVYIGLWTDFDLGNASDDYVACDTMLNTYYCYNGDNDDDGTFGYGLNPPMMNVTILKGPTVQSADALDNNHNGIIDESGETAGLSSFLYYITSNVIPVGEPFLSQEYYYYLTSRWLDGMHWTYGSSGRDPGNPLTNYIFSGIPYNTAANNWTMLTAGLQPDDMRGTGATGPFTIGPGESRTIDFAYIFTRDSINPNGLTTSIAKNTADVQKIINGFNTGNYPCLTSVGLPALANPSLDFNLYPNPATNTLYFNKEMIGAEYKIYSVTGQLIKSGVFNGSSIQTGDITPQLYIIKASKEGKNYTKRFVKM